MHLSCWFVEIFRQSPSQIIEHAVWFANIIYKWIPRPLLEQFILDSLAHLKGMGQQTLCFQQPTIFVPCGMPGVLVLKWDSNEHVWDLRQLAAFVASQ